MKKLLYGLAGGFAGALTTTLLHELLRYTVPDSPRLDKLGEEALDKSAETLTGNSIPDEYLYPASMAADVFSNAWYYSAAAASEDHPVESGVVLGLLAGVGAVKLPGRLGLDESTSSGSATRSWITIGLYTLGGAVAGLVIKKLAKANN